MIAKLIDAKDMSATLSLLRHRFPRMEVKGEGISLPELEAALDRSIASQKAHAFARSILSVGVVLGLLLLKEEEVNNLRKIAKGKEFRMSESDVRATLVVV
jgi:vacuolar-type H+-ATPase subunit C/Vma6